MTTRATRLTAILSATLLAVPAYAGTIVIDHLGDGVSDDGGSFNGFTMTDIDQQATTTPGAGNEADDVQCITGGFTGQMCFQGQNGVVSDVDIVNDPQTSGGESWWEYPGHGNVFVTNYSWIEILLPEDTLAITLWVGASFSGTAWIGAFDDDGHYLQTQPNFSVGIGDTEGYGISSDGCTYLDKVVVEPRDWGFGHISLSQGDFAPGCVEVPEPPPLALFLTGLFGLALARQLVVKVQETRSKG